MVGWDTSVRILENKVHHGSAVAHKVLFITRALPQQSNVLRGP
jgi:hypothetical protein